MFVYINLLAVKSLSKPLRMASPQGITALAVHLDGTK